MVDEFKLLKIIKDELEIVKELYKEYGGCFEEIVMIIECQSRFVRKVMEVGELYIIRFYYFGKFEVVFYQV